MKKTLLTLISSVALFVCVNAQVSSYPFTQSSGTYTPITGGSVLGDTLSDDQRFVDSSALAGGTTTTGIGFPIGFNFTYNGQVFNRFAVNTNGWIGLGQSSLGATAVNISNGTGSSYYPLTATSTATPSYLRSRIAGFATDLQAQAGAEIRTQTIGTTPNRVCVVQWKNFSKYPSSTGGDNFNFQIRLHETSNTVDVVYGSFTNNTDTTTVQVGLGGTTNTDFNNRKASTSWTSSVSGTSNADSCLLSATKKPASGLTFSWATPAACTGTPTAGTASAPTSVCSGINFDLTLAGYTNGVSGITFQWQSSSSLSGTYTNIANATTPIFTTAQTATTYYKCVVSCSGGSTATSNAVTVGMSAASACYCTPTSGGTSCISHVTINTLNHSTSGCSSSSNVYTSFPADSATTTLKLDSTYTLTVSINDSINPAIGSVWIDFNQNGMFDSVEWTLLDSNFAHSATVSIMVPNTAQTGTTRMRIRTRNTGNANGATDACTAFFSGEAEDYTITISNGSSTGVKEINLLENMIIYPNPTSGVFNITSNEAKFSEMTINVIDIQGKVVYSSIDKNVSSSYNKQINLEGLSKGLYYIKLSTNNGVKVQKLIVQ